MWDSFDKNPLIASVPSSPLVPPSTLNIFKLSSNPSWVIVISNGNLVLSPLTVPLNVIEPLTNPVLLVNDEGANVGFVNGLPPASLITKSFVSIVALKFCWLITNSIVLSIAVDEDDEANENTGESDVIVNILASSPASPCAPCLDLTKLIVLVNCVLPLVAVISTLPLSCDNAVIVTLLPLSVAVTPVPLEDEIT